MDKLDQTVKNPFEDEAEAKRYDRYRPRYHHLFLERVRPIVGHGFESALDVACGTGHSTTALMKYAKRTVGCDLSSAMLTVARKNPGIEFVQANAEAMPFSDSEFDFVTVSMGFHWLEPGAFMREVRRVLKAGGFFCVDNYGFQGRISNDAEKQKLHHDLFVSKLPAASRRAGYPTLDEVGEHGFELVQEIKYEHRVSLTAEEFSNLVMTWSNFQVLSPEIKPAVAEEIQLTYNRIFAGASFALDFAGKAMLMRRMDG